MEWSERRASRTRCGAARAGFVSVWPGIDLVYHGRDGALEYDFELAPAALSEQIRLAFDGAKERAIGRHGDLVLSLVRGKSPEEELELRECRLTRAQLLQPVFPKDIVECPRCRGRRKLIAVIADPAVAERFLASLELPRRSPARRRAVREEEGDGRGPVEADSVWEIGSREKGAETGWVRTRSRRGRWAWFRKRVRGLGLKEVLCSPHSPWQNGYAERLIGSIRRECLDHVIVLNERHLMRLMGEYAKYHNAARTHLSLNKDPPLPRLVHGLRRGRCIVEFPHLGGLHHHYERRAA